MSYGSDSWAKWVLNEDKSLPLLKAAWDAGIQTWDTADVYSNVSPHDRWINFQGVSEMVIRKAVEKYKIPRSKLVLLTKCFGTVHDDPYGGRTAPGSESTKEYVNKHGNFTLPSRRLAYFRIESKAYFRGCREQS
jgi:aryl-alcohol dehydrogenase-like predicted oxidoreductase